MKMAKHEITEEEYVELKGIAKTNKNKKTDKRLQVIILRYEGKKLYEIAEKLDYTYSWVRQLCTQFKKQGVSEYAGQKYIGNNQAVDKDTEEKLINAFRKKAESGQIVSAMEIKKAFDKYRGKDTGRGYIYSVLKRHNWRTVMPRGKHPKGASDEEIADSKKLTLDTKN